MEGRKNEKMTQQLHSAILGDCAFAISSRA